MYFHLGKRVLLLLLVKKNEQKANLSVKRTFWSKIKVKLERITRSLRNPNWALAVTVATQMARSSNPFIVTWNNFIVFMTSFANNEYFSFVRHSSLFSKRWNLNARYKEYIVTVEESFFTTYISKINILYWAIIYQITERILIFYQANIIFISNKNMF